jgi:hypothetical protein
MYLYAVAGLVLAYTPEPWPSTAVQKWKEYHCISMNHLMSSNASDSESISNNAAVSKDLSGIRYTMRRFSWQYRGT